MIWIRVIVVLVVDMGFVNGLIGCGDVIEKVELRMFLILLV